MNNDNIIVGFLGLGLIGGSIARAIRKAYPSAIIRVYTRRENPDLEQGKADGIISSLHYEINEDFSDCDVIFLCAPVLRNLEFLPLIQPFLKKDCILTDVGSVKGNIHTAVSEHNLDSYFIGGHPMAGSEKYGFINSSAILLENAFYLLTRTPKTTDTQLERLKSLLTCTGSRFVVLDPKEHDEATAAISHMPHVIAATLVNTVRENDSSEEYMKQFAAGGFKDTTRIASSSPEMWESICLSNKESIDLFLGYFIDKLTEFRTFIANDDGEKIREQFRTAGEYRDSLYN
nr:prephenate dehydrogenase/arogenate dehydrogenase family protein [Eubacterium sp.]